MGSCILAEPVSRLSASYTIFRNPAPGSNFSVPRQRSTLLIHIPINGRVHQAKVLWRVAAEIGIRFVEDVTAPVRYLDADGLTREDNENISS
jgi:hypothetical protein